MKVLLKASVLTVSFHHLEAPVIDYMTSASLLTILSIKQRILSIDHKLGKPASSAK